jgi:hypothetical protein
MGKNNKHKKFLKSEKAKVKLKGGKKLLVKGQNITDTSFKVKKIVIQSQLVQQLESEPVTRKNLNLKVRYPWFTLEFLHLTVAPFAGLDKPMRSPQHQHASGSPEWFDRTGVDAWRNPRAEFVHLCQEVRQHVHR